MWEDSPALGHTTTVSLESGGTRVASVLQPFDYLLLLMQNAADEMKDGVGLGLGGL